MRGARIEGWMATSGRGGITRRLWLVVIFYLAASALLVGRQALADPAHVCACIGGGDPTAYMWAMRWWPYSITHGLNPLYTHLAWSPSGVNVAASGLIAFPSLAAWPLTATLGLLPTYNVFALLSPALAASTMYLLCRYLTGRWLPSLVAGWLFGFSSYELSQMIGHADLMMTALLPLFPLVVLLRLDGRIRRPGFVAAMAVLFAVQVLTSPELLITGCTIGAFALILAWLMAPASRDALLRAALEIVAGGLIAALIISPYLYEALHGHPAPPRGSTTTDVNDLAGLVVPTSVTMIRYAQGVAAKLPGNLAEQGAYLGIPLLLGFCAALWRLRRDLRGWVLAGVGFVALLWSLGSTLHVGGDASIPLPWRVVAHLPIARTITPNRVIVYLWLALSIAVALWLAAPGRWRPARWALVAVGIVLILPDGSSPLYRGRPYQPALFSTSAYKRVLTRGSMVLLLPYASFGNSMLWQAQSGFWFRMPEGYLSGVPADGVPRRPARAEVSRQPAGSRPADRHPGVRRALSSHDDPGRPDRPRVVAGAASRRRVPRAADRWHAGVQDLGDTEAAKALGSKPRLDLAMASIGSSRARTRASRWAAARLEVIPGAGHPFFIEQPGATLAAIGGSVANWLDRRAYASRPTTRLTSCG